jgi:hypothetical protein
VYYGEATLPNLINDDETLVNFITTKRPAKREREGQERGGTRERTQVRAKSAPSQKGGRRHFPYLGLSILKFSKLPTLFNFFWG